MSTAINFTPMVTLQEAAEVIAATGDEITNILIAEPGIGKTSVLKMMEEMLGDEYDYIYVDCPVKEMMDIGAAIPNHERQTLEYYVASLFKLSGEGANRPKVIMLDELFKAPKLMQIIFTRLILERMVGDVPLPVSPSGKKSIVIGTSNNAKDGVGDASLGHINSRAARLYIKKHNAPQWDVWAAKNGIHRIVRAWVSLNPRCMASYQDGGQEDNPYIFFPNNNRSYVCGRTLAMSSVTITRRNKMTENAVMSQLSGLLGESAARSMAAFISMEAEVVDVLDVLKDPMGTKVPGDLAPQVMMMFQAIDVIKTQDELSSFMKYMNRIDSAEVQAIFFTMLCRDRVKLARGNEFVTKWARDNYVLL
jgi:hypothetical protein